jgi:hypothetical protein
MRTFTHILAAASALALLPPALAQDKLAPPHEKTTESVADKPMTIAAAAPDADISKLLGLLAGTFESSTEGDHPALSLHAAPVSIPALPNTLVVEIARTDSPASPFRIYYLHAFRRQGELRLRVIDFAGSGQRDALAGLWAAPDQIPRSDPANLIPSADMRVTPNAAGFDAATPQPFPTTRDGAIEMTSSIGISDSALRIADTGIDADGLRVWGQKPGEFLSFKRTQVRPIITREDHLVSITTIPAPASAPKLIPGGQVVLHYTSWLTTGQLIETSRGPGKQPATVHIPGNVLPGLNRGLISIAAGERRKIVIGPELAYGAEGRGVIPPNATLIFDVECLKIDNDAPAPPPAPTQMFNPHAALPSSPTSAPPRSDGPIGTPPTNGGPESPRGGPH